MHKDGDFEIINGEKTGLIWSTKYEDWIYPDLEEHPEKYHSKLYFNPNRTPDTDPPKDGEKEYIDGEETGLIWSEKYNDWIHPDLDQHRINLEPQAVSNIQICYTCEHWIKNQRRCNVCGCFMDVKHIVNRLLNKMIGVEDTNCPLGKW